MAAARLWCKTREDCSAREPIEPYHASVSVRRSLPEMGMSKALIAQSMVTGALRPVPEHTVVRRRLPRRVRCLRPYGTAALLRAHRDADEFVGAGFSDKRLDA
jgi:hypothetical protein